jgi:hypothetical protein
MTAPRNDATAPVTRFALAVEEHRRTPDGRVRTAQQFSSWFFCASETNPDDKLFRHLPKDVRGPIVSGWGIRGAKAALKDSDAKVATVVSDAILAGDLSASDLEQGLSPSVVISWVPLTDWWAFWRGGVHTKTSTQRALVTAYELGLFDAAWMFDNLEAKGGTQKGTLVVSEGLSKEDLVEWVRRIHESRDGTPKGLLEAMGWDKLIAKTTNEALFGLLDALAKKVGLVTEQDQEPRTDPPPPNAEEVPAAAIPPASKAPEASVDAKASSPPPVLVPAPPLTDPDLAETGPYSLPGNSPRRKEPETTRKLLAAQPVDIPVDMDEPESDETKRFMKRGETTSMSKPTRTTR